MILIINGSLGVGKTETSWELVGLFERAVMLDGDYIGAVHPFEIHNSQRVDYLYRTISHLIQWHQQHGYNDFVVNYVFEKPESLARFKRMMLELSDVVYIFRLTCAEAEQEQRIRARGKENLAWELKRFRELNAIQQAAANQGDLGYPLDTTGQSAAQVAQKTWQLSHEKIVVAPYNPAWAEQFEAEAAAIKAAVGDLALEIHHIGSTSVPGLPAKPVIDSMLLVSRLEDFVNCIEPLQALGYSYVYHPKNQDRRFFKKGVPRSHHLHIVAQDSPALRRHLTFRDALRADAGLRQKYAALKQASAARYGDRRTAYTASKAEFIEGTLKERRKAEG